MTQPKRERLSFLDRYLTLWIFLAMALGVLLGLTFAGLPAAIDSLSWGSTNIPIAIGTLSERLQPMPKLALATVADAAVAFIVSSYGEASNLPGSWGSLMMLAVSSKVVGQRSEEPPSEL